MPNIPWDELNLRFVDLDGDGHADVLITKQDVFTWHPPWRRGVRPTPRILQPLDVERGPRLVLADGTQSIYLTDLVRIRNGEVCYWPKLGFGLFGAKVILPCFLFQLWHKISTILTSFGALRRAGRHLQRFWLCDTIQSTRTLCQPPH